MIYALAGPKGFVNSVTQVEEVRVHPLRGDRESWTLVLTLGLNWWIDLDWHPSLRESCVQVGVCDQRAEWLK